MNKQQIINLKILASILTFISVVNITFAVLPPEARQKRCEESGGWMEGECICPKDATSLWSRCWIKTPKESCLELGGIPEMVSCSGPQGCGFRCIKNKEDITNSAIENSETYKPRILIFYLIGGLIGIIIVIAYLKIKNKVPRHFT